MNAIILGQKIRMKQRDLDAINVAIADQEDEINKLLSAVDETETEEDLATLEHNLEELNNANAKKIEERNALSLELETMKAQLKELNDKKPKTDERGNFKMEQLEVRSALNAYVKSKGELRDSVKIVDAGALIQPEILAPKETPREVVVLENLVNKVSVNTSAGMYPVITKSGKKMNSVEELEKNPELTKPKINKVDFKVDTYRGYIPISQEAIDDAEYDLTRLIADEIADQELNTKNSAIASVFKTATQKSAQGFDGLKDIINKEVKRYYDVTMVVTQSMFNALDKVKDKEGRYMLQNDITSPTGYKFAGKTIHVLPDDVLGDEAGEMKAFIGDTKAFVTLFDRAQTSVKWIDNNIYGQLLAGFVRFGVKKVDEEAGFYVTYTDAV